MNLGLITPPVVSMRLKKPAYRKNIISAPGSISSEHGSSGKHWFSIFLTNILKLTVYVIVFLLYLYKLSILFWPVINMHMLVC